MDLRTGRVHGIGKKSLTSSSEPESSAAALLGLLAGFLFFDPAAAASRYSLSSLSRSACAAKFSLDWNVESVIFMIAFECV